MTTTERKRVKTMDVSNYWDDFVERVELTKVAVLNKTNPSLKRLTVHLTEGCNLKCRYCNMKINKREMHVATAKKAVREFAEAGGSIVHFTGGEPTIVPYFEYICEYAKERGLQVSSNTNAVQRVSVKHVDKLKSSFDTCNKEDFNNTVGFDVFDRVVSNLKYYSENMSGKVLSITAVLNRKTYPHMLELAKFCEENFDLYNLYFSNYKGDDPEFSFLSKGNIDHMFETSIPEVIEYFKATGQEYSAKQLSLYSCEDFLNGLRFPENKVVPCYLQLSEMVIAADGECHNCSHLYRDGVKGSGYNVCGTHLMECFNNMKNDFKGDYCFISEKCLNGCNPNLIAFNKKVSASLLEG